MEPGTIKLALLVLVAAKEKIRRSQLAQGAYTQLASNLVENIGEALQALDEHADAIQSGNAHKDIQAFRDLCARGAKISDEIAFGRIPPEQLGPASLDSIRLFSERELWTGPGKALIKAIDSLDYSSGLLAGQLQGGLTLGTYGGREERAHPKPPRNLKRFHEFVPLLANAAYGAQRALQQYESQGIAALQSLDEASNSLAAVFHPAIVELNKALA